MKPRFSSMIVITVGIIALGWAGTQYLGYNPFNAHSNDRIKTSGETSSGTTVEVNVLISFGNGTKVWFNRSIVPNNYNYYNVTYKIVGGNLEGPWDPTQHGHFVQKILGYGCNLGDFSCPGYWSLWTWDEANQCWSYSQVGVDRLSVSDVTTIAWHFLYYDNHNPLDRRC